MFGKFIKGQIQRQNLFARPVRDNVSEIYVAALHVAAPLVAAFAASCFHKYSPHGLGGGGEEVAAAIPSLQVIGADEPEVGFVDEGRCLQRLAWLFLRKFSSSQLT